MIKLLIAYDHLDSNLGHYFEACFADVSSHVSSIVGFEIVLINSSDATSKAVTDKIETFEERPFIFVAFTHGRADAILMASKPVVHLKNAYFFGNSLVYTCACEVAKDLGKALHQHGCKAFIGYESISRLYTVPKYDNIFMACENYGIKAFLTGEKTVRESYDEMIEYFTEKMFELTHENALAAAYLLDNRNTLVIYPEDANFRLNDFL